VVEYRSTGGLRVDWEYQHRYGAFAYPLMICTMISTEDFVLPVSVVREPVRSGEWGMSFFRDRKDVRESWSEMGGLHLWGGECVPQFYSDRHN
jgi:hypothetical protein